MEGGTTATKPEGTLSRQQQHTQQKENDRKKASDKTPNYDLVATNTRKYIIGGAALFIPDLCKALKEDWYPRLSTDEIKKIDYIRNELKHKILSEWCSERSEDGIGWSYSTIEYFWPVFLESEGQTRTRAYRQYRSFMESMGLERRKVYGIVEGYADVPIDREEEDAPEGTPHKERKRTPERIYKDFMNSIKVAWTSLYDYNDMPGPDLDMETKILQPSEKYRLRLLKGLPDLERKVLLSQISQFCFAGVGFLKYAKLVQSQEAKVEK